MINKLVLASNNAGKLKEFAALLAPLGIEVIPQGRLNVPECPEPHYTFLENALEKARHASHVTGLPALADDSGICVEALGGKPGVLSARYAGEPKSDERNNAKLVEKLQGKDNRRAYYYCVLVLVRHADDPQPLVVDGAWYGEWWTPRPATAALATTRTSGCRRTAAPWPTCRPTPRTPSATVARPCRRCWPSCRRNWHERD